MSFWKSYWEDKENGGHRCQEEVFLQKEAQEKLYHLNGGNSLLDFGCGSADLLAYYAQTYPKTVGADFSQSMLDNARKRLDAFGCINTILVLADDSDVWDKVSDSFDRITSAGVVQHLGLDQIDVFISTGSKRLNGGGKIIIFDIIDPRIYFLFKMGIILPPKSSMKTNLGKIIKGVIGIGIAKIKSVLKRIPADLIGYAHHPHDIFQIAEKYGLDAEYVCSMYYEYRYHMILTKKL